MQTVGLPYKFFCFFLEILKKNPLKMTSQLVIFKAFFSFIFRPPDLKSEKKSGKSTNTKILALKSGLSVDPILNGKCI